VTNVTFLHYKRHIITSQRSHFHITNVTLLLHKGHIFALQTSHSYFTKVTLLHYKRHILTLQRHILYYIGHAYDYYGNFSALQDVKTQRLADHCKGSATIDSVRFFSTVLAM